MAFDEGLLQIMRDDLSGIDGVTERKMFGGVAMMLHGNMICGVHTHGAMFRVGKDREAEARMIDGTGPMEFTGRPMGGMVGVDDDAFADDERRASLMSLALANARSLPPK